MTTIHVNPAASEDELTHATIQRAIDDAARRGGGTVHVPSGTYHMRDALHLRTGVHVVGEGKVTLRKVPSVASTLKHGVGFGHREFIPADPDRFHVGDGVHLASERTAGFLDCVATIIERCGDVFYIDQPAHYDYRTNDNARAATVHSLVEATDVRDASVRGLTLDGSDETSALNGCRGGGVFLLRSHRITIEQCEVDRFNGDGVSFQQCTDIHVRRCVIHHCTGCGLHPGSGSVRYVIAHNQAHHNGRDGLFYCLRTTHSIAEHNHLHHNAGSGISVGERDTDHLLQHNRIHDNAGPGVFFRPPVTQGGDRTRLHANTIGPNGNIDRAGQPTGEIDIAAGLDGIDILENAFTTDDVSPIVSVGAEVRRIHVAGNTRNGRDQQPGDVRGPESGLTFAPPQTRIALGPAALPAEGARHLGIATLPPWEPTHA